MRPTWTRELLCLQMGRDGFAKVSVATMGRALSRLGARIGMPKPIVLCPWPRDARKKRLAELLTLLRDAGSAAYSWSDPIMLGDGVVVLAFRDRSLAGRTLSDGHPVLVDYVLNLIRPVVFPFLHDCAAVAHLRLAERIEMRVTTERSTIAEMALPVDEIVEPNGHRLLWPLAG